MTPTLYDEGVIMLAKIAYVALGAVIGGVARFLVTHLSSEISQHHGFPYGTLAVNALGCVFVGYVLTWTADHTHDTYRLLMATGFCGGFTTFSAFAYESLAYWHEGRTALFFVNLAANNALSLAGVALGIKLHNTH
jgi:CrcB protein